MKLRAPDVAQMALFGAQVCFERDGYVVPTMMFIADDDRGIVLHPDPRLGDEPTEAYAQIVFRVGKLRPWRIVGIAAETWTKTVALDSPEDVGHGDLERAALAGDATVDTAVLGMALDFDFAPASHTLSSVMRRNDDGTVTWETDDMPGYPTGEMADMIYHAYAAAKVPEFTNGTGLPPMELLCDVLVEVGIATSAMLLVAEL